MVDSWVVIHHAMTATFEALGRALHTRRQAVLGEGGVAVHGIDLSTAMVRRLRAKPGGRDIGVTIGDFATTRVDGSFPLVYLVFNTIGNLTTQEAQVACFRNAAAHLEPGGTFGLGARALLDAWRGTAHETAAAQPGPAGAEAPLDPNAVLVCVHRSQPVSVGRVSFPTLRTGLVSAHHHMW